MMELKNPIKMFKIRKRMSPPIPLVMRIIILFDWIIEPSSCFIGHKDSHSIGEKIILDFHWFMKDEETIDWRERFSNFHWTRRTSSRKGHGSLPKGEGSILRFGKEKEENECVRKKINSYVWKGVVYGKDVCKQEHGKKLCVASTYSGVHGRISITKPLDFYFK
jgi:hypothetical protein